jgi:TctA family transporter
MLSIDSAGRFPGISSKLIVVVMPLPASHSLLPLLYVTVIGAAGGVTSAALLLMPGSDSTAAAN